jgi:hypothetical protein
MAGEGTAGLGPFEVQYLSFWGLMSHNGLKGVSHMQVVANAASCGESGGIWAGEKRLPWSSCWW